MEEHKDRATAATRRTPGDVRANAGSGTAKQSPPVLRSLGVIGTEGGQEIRPEQPKPKFGTASIGKDNKGRNRLQVDYDGAKALVSFMLDLSPTNTTSSTTNAVNPTNSSSGTKITYTCTFPATIPMKDLHVQVWDCDESHYQVSGLPAGWKSARTTCCALKP